MRASEMDLRFSFFGVVVSNHITRVVDNRRLEETESQIPFQTQRHNAAKWTAGFGYEFIERRMDTPFFRNSTTWFSCSAACYGLGLTYKALASHQVDVIAGNSTDG